MKYLQSRFSLLFVLLLVLLTFVGCQKDVIHPIAEPETGVDLNAQKTSTEEQFDFIFFPTFEFNQTEEGLSVTFVDRSNATGIITDGCGVGTYVTAIFIPKEESEPITHDWSPFILEGNDDDVGGTYIAINKSEHLFKDSKEWKSVVLHIGAFAQECLLIPTESAIGIRYGGNDQLLAYNCQPIYEGGPKYCNGDPIALTLQWEDMSIGGLKQDIEVLNPHRIKTVKLIN